MRGYSQKPVCSGVPQGSILGPVLFLLYVNDLPDAVTNSSVACFADDTKIFRRVDSITDAMLLQDLNKQLTSMPTEDLGIWIASDLTWSKYVLNRCARTNKLLGYVKRSSGEISNVRDRRSLYLSLVRSVFGYSVWSPQTVILMQRVERVQRRATKYILNLPYLCSETYQE